MLTPKQIDAIIRTEVMACDAVNLAPGFEAAAQKIYDLCKPDHTIHVAAAALENEVTSTLLDMLAATILATLIEEEGGGRTNIRFSPGDMQEAMKNWDYKVDHEGMVRNVRITPKLSADWNIGEEPPSKLDSLLMTDDIIPPDPGALGLNLKPQAAPHEYNRPEWTVSYPDETGTGHVFMRARDKAEAERLLRGYKNPLAHVENRWCLHGDCPSTGCMFDARKRDNPEATSA